MKQLAILAILFSQTATAQTDWPAYGHDPGGMRYSPLDRINTKNVSRLRRAWTYHTGETGRQFETTPIVVGGRMYLTTQDGNAVALVPESGKEIWRFNAKVPRPRESRGVSYWPGDRRTPPRILLGTGDGRLISLDANTGQPDPGFGDNGTVNLRAGVADAFPNAAYAITSPPAIYKDLVIVGPSTQEGPSRGPSGDPRAFDARTGKLVWRFHTVPQPGEPGNDSWGPDGWKDRAGPSLWGLIHVDTANGLVILSTGNTADSWYGADRPGTNLYANCVLALDAQSGKLRWHFQTVHHDIFDYDVPGAPALIDVVRDGRKTPAVAQITKMGLLFILDRLTGKPIFGVEERAVPASEVPGEQSWPTQPFPLKPPPLGRTTITRDELAKRTPESARYCAELFDSLKVGSLYTPFGAKKTLVFPGAMGGGNWGGVAFDPQRHYVFVNTTNMAAIGNIVKSPPGGRMPYYNQSGYARFLDQNGYPCQQPPWGELSAVNANTGEIAWKVPLGHFAELEPLGMKNTGTPNVGGPIATAGGLVFIAATNDAKLRAFDSQTGQTLWSTDLDASGNATPITYLGADGQQYVVIAAGGPAHLRNVGDTSQDRSDTLIAFSLNGRDTSGRTVPRSLISANVPVRTDLPDAEGKPLVVRMCTPCHGVATFANAKMSREEWTAEVRDMMGRGAVGTPAEAERVVAYLAANLAGPAGSRRAPFRINAANVEELQSGLSLTRAEAEALVEYRRVRGPFREQADVLKVPGLDAAKVSPSRVRLVF